MTSTIKDVARQAGVGVGTVSRVLNGHPSVSQITRQRVLAVIQQLEFTPNTTARQLSTRRTMRVGVIVPFFTRPSFVERLQGVEQALTQNRYDLVLYNVETVEKRNFYFQKLERNNGVDGWLVMSLFPNDPEAQQLSRWPVQVVLIDASHALLDFVAIDDFKGGQMATDHLVGLGHKRIAFLGDYLDSPFGFASTWQRYRGYRHVLATSGIPFRAEYHQQAEHGQMPAQEMSRDLLDLPEPPTAIVAGSDTQAIGVLQVAQEMGLRIPKDLSVIGYDDIEVAKYFQLTTIRQPLYQSGVEGVNLLLNRINHGITARQSLALPTELIARHTTGMPAQFP